MMNKTLLDELDKSSYAAGPLIGTMLGAVLGPVILVAIAVAIIVAASHWHRWLGVVLSIPPCLGVLTTFYELVVAIAVGRSVEAGGYTRGAAVALVVVKALQFCLFVAAAVFLYRSVIEFS